MDRLIRIVPPNGAVEVFGVKLIGVTAENGVKLLFSAALVAFSILIAAGLRWLAGRLLRVRGDVRSAFWTRQGINLTSAIFLLLGLVSVWFDDPTRATTAFGLVTAGLAFALQKVVTAVAGYFVILRGRTFNVGDRITMGGVRGDVIALGFTQTTIMEMGQPPPVQSADPAMWVRSRQYTGRVVTVSNAPELAERSVLSTAVLFLGVGVLVGPGALGVVRLTPADPVVAALAELALFSVLFTDGMKVGLRDLAVAWRLPGRALLFGLPLTLLGTGLIAHAGVGLPWAEAMLVGAVLSPTDPVFAAAIVGREEVPARLRQLLNVESGLNDGLALPIVVALLAVVGRQEVRLGEVALEVLGGVALGLAIPWVAIRVGQLRFFGAHATYRPLGAFAIGLLVLSAAKLLHANALLAAFAAGMTVASIGPEVREAFHHFGELVAELLKLAALLVFGVLITPAFLRVNGGGKVQRGAGAERRPKWTTPLV